MTIFAWTFLGMWSATGFLLFIYCDFEKLKIPNKFIFSILFGPIIFILAALVAVIYGALRVGAYLEGKLKGE